MEVIDDVLVNGDNTTINNINADGATISTSDAGKAQWLIGFDGLLHLPLIDNTAQAINHNAAVSDDMFNRGAGQAGQERGAAFRAGLHHGCEHLAFAP